MAKHRTHRLRTAVLVVLAGCDRGGGRRAAAPARRGDRPPSTAATAPSDHPPPHRQRTVRRRRLDEATATIRLDRDHRRHGPL